MPVPPAFPVAANADALVNSSEDLAATLQAAAVPLGLSKPNLGD